MRRILESTTAPVTVHTDDGDVTQDQVRSVNFVDHNGALHGLVFHPPGTDVAGEAETEPRIVGEHSPHFAFDSPEAAVDAYENGRVV